ncbi:MAG TPA: orotate phosphoribosyltransferase [Nitrosopumilaceae archaeon]|nr:orotate phosphoribosyltransferase [Nitrosopumilaceae archaeon]
MEFVKEFATFLHQNGIIKFGNFTLSSGKSSPYYIDLRLVPSYPHQFRKMVKNLQDLISEEIGFDNFNSLASVPTGGLVIASALAIETVKPLIYVRIKPKEHGTSKLIEGHIQQGMKVIMIDDVATTGGSMINGIKLLKKEGIIVKDAYVILNRLEGAKKGLELEGVKMHQLTDIIEITECLLEEKLVSKEVLEKIKQQVNQN